MAYQYTTCTKCFELEDILVQQQMDIKNLTARLSTLERFLKIHPSSPCKQLHGNKAQESSRTLVPGGAPGVINSPIVTGEPRNKQNHPKKNQKYCLTYGTKGFEEWILGQQFTETRPELNKVNFSLNKDTFYQQFIPFLKDELYEKMSEIRQQLNKIDSKEENVVVSEISATVVKVDRSNQYGKSVLINNTVIGNQQKDKHNILDKSLLVEEGVFVDIHCDVEVRSLPKTDYSLSKELILIPILPTIAPASGYKIKNIFHAIVLMRNEFIKDEKSGQLKQPKSKRIIIRLLKSQYSLMNREMKKGNNLKFYHVEGLIPYERQWLTCLNPPDVFYEKKFRLQDEKKQFNVDQDDDNYDIDQNIIRNDRDISLNRQQKHIVNKISRMDMNNEADLLCFQGPPGTGKSFTMIQAVLSVLRGGGGEGGGGVGKRVMVCAPSNVAVLACIRHLSQEKLPDGMNVTWVSHGISNDIDEEENEQNEQRGTTAASSSVVGDVNGDKNKTINDDKNVDTDLNQWRIDYFSNLIIDPFLKLKNKIEKRLNDNLKINKDKLTKELIRICQETVNELNNLIRDEDTGNIIKRTLNPDDMIIDKIKQLISTLTLTHSANPFKDDKELYNAIQENTNNLLNHKECIEIFHIQKANIIFCTLVSSGTSLLSKNIKNVNILIIDESANCTIPEILIPMRYNPNLCIHFGDHKQLPPSISSKKAPTCYGKSLMEHRERKKLHAYMLEEQYRMHPSINRFPSFKYYEGKLKTSYYIKEERCDLELSSSSSDIDVYSKIFNTPSAVISVSQTITGGGGGGGEYKPIGSFSYRNEEEAYAIIDCLKVLIESNKSSSKKFTIGIISFYKEQVKLIKEILNDNKIISKHDIESYLNLSKDINTVDAFQGNERDIIMISVVRTRTQDAGFLKDLRRINVALTRSKYRRWLFSSEVNALKKSGTDLGCLLNEDECRLIEFTKTS